MKKPIFFTLLCLLGFGAARTAQAATEIYAVLDGTTTTFYYDSKKADRGGARYWELSWSAEKTKFLYNTKKVIFDSSMDDARPTSTKSWFSSFEKLEEIVNMPYLHTDEVTDMAEMFAHCRTLKTLDVTGFNTANVTSMNALFMYCDKLECIDIRNFDVSKVKDISRIFAFDYALKTIYCSQDWTGYSFDDSNYMFMSCTSLVGENGTEYDDDHIGLEYAQLDGLNGKPGYFSRKKEVYAELDEATGTLTYYYDTKREARTGTTAVYNGETTWTDPFKDKATKAVIDESMKQAEMTSMAYLFNNLQKVESIDDLQNLNTTNVEDMYQMFASCKVLKSLDLNSFNTSNVTSMYSMFSNCEYLTAIDLSSFNTAKVTNMSKMFYLCRNLPSLNLLSFKTDALKNTSEMFQGCKALTTIYSGEDWNTGKVTKSDNMFIYCKALVGVNGTAYDEGKVDIEYAHPDGLNGKPGYFTEQKTEVYAELDKVTGTMTYYYDDQRFAREGITVRYNPESYNPENSRPLGNNSESVMKAVIDESMKQAEMTDMSYLFSGLEAMTEIEGLSNLITDKVTDMSYMFNDCMALTSLDLSAFNTGNVTNMSHMFLACMALTSLDISSFNTSNVTDMSYMFGCPALKELDLSSFNTANVITMENMFLLCGSLTSLDLSSFNTANVKTMENMFVSCGSLTSLDLNSFNTEKVENMSGMFMQCESLTSLDLSSFNTKKVEDMSMMFAGCESLTSLDLRSFNIYNLIELRATVDMFNGCKALTTIYCNEDWSEINVSKKNSEDMFADCVALVGGNGTAYDDSKVDIEYARPDGLDDKPGYFTAVYTHAVTLVAENGTISVEEDVDLDNVPYGTTLHLIATPNLGYEFAGWTNYDPETGLKVVSDITVTATFNLTATYRVTAVSADDALGEVTLTFDNKDVISTGEEANDFTVVPNAVGHLVATPKDKFTTFVIWNDEAYDIYYAERDITVTGDFDYIATFHKDSFNVAVTVEGIDPALVKINGAGRYGYGDNVTLTFTLNDDNYDFDMWLFDSNNFRKTETLQFEEIDGDHDVRIVFKAKYYAVSATVIPEGAGVVKGQGDYEYGSNYTLTLEPAEGWELKEWRDGEVLEEKSNVLTGYVYGTIHIDCVMQKKEATALDTTDDNTAAPARKFINNGILLIERNGTTYTVHGAALK